MVFGIIVDTFRELRKETSKNDYDIANVCFICGVSKDELEKDNINYESHIVEEHYVWDYVNYMVGLKDIDEQEANAVTNYAMEKIKNKDYSWFPSYVTKSEEGGEEVKKEIEKTPANGANKDDNNKDTIVDLENDVNDEEEKKKIRNRNKKSVFLILDKKENKKD